MSIRRMIAHLCLALGLLLPGSGLVARNSAATRPTIVLVHGAFAESSSWDAVIARLSKDGYRVIAAANPLRGVRRDADSLGALLRSIDGPVVLVGHSYGGMLISDPVADRKKVVGLVYVAAFLPEAGESALGLSGKFPGSTLGSALAPGVRLPGGDEDLYIEQSRFRHQFAADVPAAQARTMAATQRPIARSALGEAAQEPAWRTIRSWSIYGTADLNIPAAAHVFMAKRAQVRRVIAVPGASHVVMVSHPDAVAALVEQAAAAR
ncbi:alpha/beta hydrolase [Sphingomonas daechungensis]|uniref:Alpha/beta hydrolase n=1 Tax=Sphingomonas daechungensis TaxID=1176646 RepID=A0ABX6T374_9SPHN|nr:alpha/beta hydrolase [Sphingomonas daechungensis]QNP43163.1 alpha/beta hydrolase [Sphingomonas daechungensis]